MLYLSIESISPLWLPIGLIFAYLTVVIILAEGLNRLIPNDSEITRKVVHIGTGNVILLAWWLKIPVWLCLGASAIASIIAVVSYFIPILPSINSVKRQSLGTFFYAISIGVLIAWFWPLNQPQYAAIGILVMTWGDGFAAIVGQNFGQHKYHFFGITKSWEGSFAMACVSFFVTCIILLFVQGNSSFVWLISLSVGIFAAFVEAFSKLGIDNLTVPIGTAALCFFLNQFSAIR